MSDLFWLSEAQVDLLRPIFPKSRGKPRVGDRRVLGGIILIQRSGLMWEHAPAAHGPPKTLYNLWMRWSQMEVFATIMGELVAEKQETGIVIIDATQTPPETGWLSSAKPKLQTRYWTASPLTPRTSKLAEDRLCAQNNPEDRRAVCRATGTPIS